MTQNASMVAKEGDLKGRALKQTKQNRYWAQHPELHVRILSHTKNKNKNKNYLELSL